MVDILIFGFGLGVTLVVGSGLASYVTANNRFLEDEAGAEHAPSSERVEIPEARAVAGEPSES